MGTCSNGSHFNNRNTVLTASMTKLYNKLREEVSTFYRRHTEVFGKYNFGFKTPLHQGISESLFMVTEFINSKESLGKSSFQDD